MKRKHKGFSLIELMMVVSLVAILALIAYPSYAGFVRKATRAQAQAALLDWANRQANWRADHASYNASINPADTGDYTYSMVSTSSTFTLTASAINDQANDKEGGVQCTSLTINHLGEVGPAGKESCWSR